MKNLIFLLLVIIFFHKQSAISQEPIECLTEVPAGVTVSQAKSGNLSLYKRTEMISLRLMVHIVRTSQGSGGISIEELNFKVNRLNYYFQQVGFNFYIDRINYIDSDEFYNIDNKAELDLLRSTYTVPGYINVYFVNYLMDAYGYSSFSPRIDNGPQGIVIKNSAHETTLPHEMGHYFDLFHTYQIWEEQPGGPQIYENIAREGSCMNCTYAGDLLCDTPADPSGRVKFSTIDNNCNWSPVKPVPADHCGRTDYNPLTNNLMITEVKHCRTTFTQQQKDRMNETLILYRSELLKHVVYIENRYDGENAGGTLSINGVTYNSGTYVPLSTGTYEFRTNNERFPNYKNRGFTIKHNNWNGNRSKYYLKNVVEIDTSKDQIANFIKLEYSKIEARLETMNFANLGKIEFQDPWYVRADGSQPGNYWITAYGIYEPNGKEGAQEKGVFLNQVPDPNNPNKPYYSVKADNVQNIYLQQTGRTHKFYFQGWSASPLGSATFQNANALETAVVFKQENATVEANYKGSLLSNNQNAFANNSQRKIVKTENGHMHLFYISMNGLWYEKSVNNGGSWYTPKLIEKIQDTYIKSFSVDYVNNKIYLIVQISDETSSIIKLYQVDENANVINFPDDDNSTIYLADESVNATPLVAANYDNILFIWKDAVGLKLIRFRWDVNRWVKSDIITIQNTTENSINPSISLVKSWQCSKVYSHLVWEERKSSKSSRLYYIRIAYIRDYVNNITFENFEDISRGSGYEVTTNPVVVEMGENDALIGFIGKRRFEDENLTPTEVRAVLTTIPFGGVFYSFGDDVQSISLNRCNTRWVFAWSRDNDLPVQFVDSRDIRLIQQLSNLKGVDVQVTNGIVVDDMFAFTLNTKSLPYPINYRAIFGEQIPIDLVVTEDAREGLVEKEGGVVYYSIGDIKVGDEKVEFTEIPDTVGMITLENANRYLISKSFMVNDNSGFVYTIKYGVSDTSSLKEALTSTDYIKFRVELVDAHTKELLGVFDEVTYTSQNLSKYENVNYYVNTSGLGERFVQLRLVITNNVDPYYAISDKFSDRGYNLQKKKAYKEVSYRGILSPKEYTYSLSQNYPNPFNPTTKIRFSIKEEVPVVLRLYDMLGREVAILMNEVKTPGEYSYELDGGKLGLSSGVYLYQMKAGGYNSIKKLIYLK